MAAEKTLAALANANLPSIEVYKANLATPQELESLRFWLQNELTRIQTTSYSIEEAIKVLATAAEDLQGQGGCEGCEDGQDGLPGAPGRSVMTFKAPDGTAPVGAQPGDIWIVEECS